MTDKEWDCEAADEEFELAGEDMERHLSLDPPERLREAEVALIRCQDVCWIGDNVHGR